MALRVITAATSDPISVDDVKEHLRIETTSEDYLLQTYIKVARQYAENYTKRSLTPQTFELRIDEFPGDGIIELPNPPLSTDTSKVVITYLDSASGNSTTLSSTVYTVDSHSEPGRVIRNHNLTWPTEYDMPHAVRVQYVSGYTISSTSTGATCPESIKLWMMMRIGQMYENREPLMTGREANFAEIPRDYVDGLLDPYVLIEVV